MKGTAASQVCTYNFTIFKISLNNHFSDEPQLAIQFPSDFFLYMFQNRTSAWQTYYQRYI